MNTKTQKIIDSDEEIHEKRDTPLARCKTHIDSNRIPGKLYYQKLLTLLI